MQIRIAPPGPQPKLDFLAPPLVKAGAIGLLVLAGLAIISVWFLMPEEANTHEAASRVQACKAYLHADPKLLKVLCNPSNWRQGDAQDGNQASLP